jgi:hypothetical protein
LFITYPVRPNSNHHLFFNSSFVFLIGFGCRADNYRIPAQQQADKRQAQAMSLSRLEIG